MKRTYYNNQPQLLLNTTGNESTRQPFNIENPPQEIVPLSRDSCFTLIITTLFVIATIGGFVYINMYLTFDLYNVVVEGKAGKEGSAPSDCSTYYCDYSAHYYVHNTAAYDKCNSAVCSVYCNIGGGSALLPEFNCSSPSLDNVAYYYSCYSSCSDLVKNHTFPPQLFVTFVVASVGGCVFGIGVIISLLYGIVAPCTGVGLYCGERFALFINFFCPSAKYYAIRARTDWEDVKINLKAMLWVDIIVTTCIAIAMACYIYIAIARAFLFYEYLVTFGMGLMLLTYSGNLHRNFLEFYDFQGRVDRFHNV